MSVATRARRPAIDTRDALRGEAVYHRDVRGDAKTAGYMAEGAEAIDGLVEALRDLRRRVEDGAGELVLLSFIDGALEAAEPEWNEPNL